MLDLIALVAGGGLCLAGGRLVLRASRYASPEAPGRVLPGAFWHYDRHTAEGRRLLRHGWALGGTGLALIVVAAI
jgi:hypothetical protein